MWTCLHETELGQSELGRASKYKGTTPPKRLTCETLQVDSFQ